MNTLINIVLAFVLQILGGDIPPEHHTETVIEMVICDNDTLQNFGYFINTRTAEYRSKNEQHVKNY